MTTIADLESKISKSQEVLDFYKNELKKDPLPNYLRKPYEEAINSHTNQIIDLTEVLKNVKKRTKASSLARPVEMPLHHDIMPPSEYLEKYGLDKYEFDPKEMARITENAPSSVKSTNSLFKKIGGSSMVSNNKKLLAAAKRGDINAVNELLSTTKNININVKDKAGNTPMMIAIKNSDSPMTHVLMSYHATVNQSTITKLNKNKSMFFRKRLMPTFKKYMKMTNKLAKKMNKNTRKHRK
jgi:hypothetical protein